MRTSIRSADQNIRAAQNFAHGVPIAAVVGVPKNRAKIFVQGQIQKCIERILIAHGGQLRDVFADVFLILGLHHFFDPRNIPAPMKIGRARIGEIGAHFSSRVGIGESLFTHFHGQEHQILPGRKLIEHLAFL